MANGENQLLKLPSGLHNCTLGTHLSSKQMNKTLKIILSKRSGLIFFYTQVKELCELVLTPQISLLNSEPSTEAVKTVVAQDHNHSTLSPNLGAL